MAFIQSDAGDYYGAQESAMQSLKHLNEKNKKHSDCLASNYNELGMTSFNLKRYKPALSYYDQALKYATDTTFRSTILNNKAVAYQKLGDYRKAISIYESIIPRYKDHPKEFARALSNITRTRWLQQPTFNAAPHLLTALAIRKKENDEWGKNASYSHLSDYYAKKLPDSAIIFAKQMYNVALKLSSPDDQLEALQKLIKLSPSAQTKRYFDTYQGLADSLQTARNASKNQFAIVRYESEKNKADNLLLQRENSEKRIQILTREFLLGLAILLFLASSVIAILWYKKRHQRMMLETENAVRDSQLKTSKRVHDVVANGLYRVMIEIENQGEVDKEHILDKIEDLYEKSRDISYEKPTLNYDNFQEKLSSILKSFATTETKIIIAGNTVGLWHNVSPIVKYELENVLQELMVNMKKHSSASNVAIRFESVGDEIHIRYTDDGVGMQEGQQFKNGLRNTGNRMEFVKGAITFDTRTDKGLRILISFPRV